MTLLLDDDAVRAVFSWQSATSALREAYAGEAGQARFPARIVARGDQVWLRTLSGVPAGSGLMGTKTIAAALATRRASYLIPLFDQRTAELVALLDGASITGYRTAATSALAADLLTPPGAATVAVIGSGFEAKHHVRALAAVRPVKAVHVYSPRPESRARFATELADQPFPVTPAETAEAALAEASLVICAARSSDESPTLRGKWLRPGMTIVSIGSTLPEQREVDTDVIARADVLVADVLDEVLNDTGDLVAARDAGVDVSDRAATLADVVAGRHPGRTGENQLIVYKSVGSAIQDLAVATMCLREAEQAGLGHRLPVTVQPVQK